MSREFVNSLHPRKPKDFLRMGKRSKIVQVIFILSLIVLLLWPTLLPSETPKLSLTLDCPDSVLCNITTDNEEILRYNGTISADFTGRRVDSGRLFVSLTANTGGWEWEIIPSSTVLDTTHNRSDFTFIVHVNPRHPATRPNRINIHGETTSLPGLGSTTITSKGLVVSVSPYLKQSVEIKGGSNNIGHRQMFKRDIQLNNLGNVPIQSQMNIIERHELELKDWTVYFQEEGNLSVGPFESVSNTLYIIPELLEKDVIDFEEVAFNITITSRPSDDIKLPDNDDLISNIEIQGKLYREIPETEWETEPFLDPASEISLEKGRKIAILETLKLGIIGGVDLTIYVLILIAAVTLIFLARYRK